MVSFVDVVYLLITDGVHKNPLNINLFIQVDYHVIEKTLNTNFYSDIYYYHIYETTFK